MITVLLLLGNFSPKLLFMPYSLQGQGFSFERELTYCRTLVWYGFLVSTFNIILITLFLATEKMYTCNFSALKIECM